MRRMRQVAACTRLSDRMLSERLTMVALVTGAALLSRRARQRAAAVAVALPHRPVVLGLTGSIGMGKSTASEWFRRCGLRVHDSDACVHALYAPGGAAVAPIEAAFPGVKAADGSIDRAALSKAVATAGREQSLKALEQLVHPLVSASRQQFVDDAAAAGEWLVVVDVPLLFETNKDEVALRAAGIDEVVVVSAPSEVQRERVLARPGMTAEKLDAILARQTPDEDKRSRADTVVTTEGFSAARAQLAACVGALAARNAPRWQAWKRRGAAAAFPAATCVTFDLDDTLWPTMPPLLRAQTTMIEELLPSHLPRAAASGRATKEAMRAALKPLAAADPLVAHDLTELRRRYMLQLAAEHGDPPEAVEPLMGAFVAARSAVAPHLYPEAAPALAALRGARLRVGALTNGNCDVAQAGEPVARLFDFAVTAAEAGAPKPAVAPFLHAAAAAGCHPSAVVHVGDSIECDLLGALACGMRAVLVTREGAAQPAEPPRPPADPARWREVRDLTEAAAVVREWAAPQP